MHGKQRIERGLARTGLAMPAAVLAAMLAAGCTQIHDHRGYLVDSTLVEALQPGVDNRASVEKMLGRPTFVSQFGQPAWYYVSMNTRQAPFTRPRTQGEWIMKVNFDPAGNVSGFEKSGMERVVRLSPDRHRTPTLGRNRSFFEDLFGNIGAVGAVPGAGGQGGQPGGGPNGS